MFHGKAKKLSWPTDTIVCGGGGGVLDGSKPPAHLTK